MFGGVMWDEYTNGGGMREIMTEILVVGCGITVLFVGMGLTQFDR